MKERPILFNSKMVRAILCGRKTQTRRVVAEKVIKALEAIDPSAFFVEVASSGSFEKIIKPGLCPFGDVGDRLWVRETYRLFDFDECPHYEGYCACPPSGTPIYKATSDNDCEKWKPSIHMPRAFARIHLEITSVRIERLMSISTEDALVEGIDHLSMNCPRHEFFQLWNSLYGDMVHQQNPWVWVVEFKAIQ